MAAGLFDRSCGVGHQNRLAGRGCSMTLRAASACSFGLGIGDLDPSGHRYGGERQPERQLNIDSGKRLVLRFPFSNQVRGGPSHPHNVEKRAKKVDAKCGRAFDAFRCRVRFPYLSPSSSSPVFCFFFGLGMNLLRFFQLVWFLPFCSVSSPSDRLYSLPCLNTSYTLPQPSPCC